MIFECDIIHIRSGESWFGGYVIDIEKVINNISDKIYTHLSDFDSITIIGNIYDNPD